jgi:hypothetical protein
VKYWYTQVHSRPNNFKIFGRLNRIANISYGHLCLRREELAFSNSREDNNMGAKFQQYRGPFVILLCKSDFLD